MSKYKENNSSLLQLSQENINEETENPNEFDILSKELNYLNNNLTQENILELIGTSIKNNTSRNEKSIEISPILTSIITLSVKVGVRMTIETLLHLKTKSVSNSENSNTNEESTELDLNNSVLSISKSDDGGRAHSKSLPQKLSPSTKISFIDEKAQENSPTDKVFSPRGHTRHTSIDLLTLQDENSLILPDTPILPRKSDVTKSTKPELKKKSSVLEKLNQGTDSLNPIQSTKDNSNVNNPMNTQDIILKLLGQSALDNLSDDSEE